MGEQLIPERLREPMAVLVSACEEEPAILAAWVGGSLARGTADDWSDVDLHVLVEDAEAFEGGIRDWFAGAMPAAYADRMPGVPGGYVFVTPDWIHVDVVVHGNRGFRQDDHPARVLVGRESTVRDVPASAREMVGRPYLPEGQVELFIYFMGATVTVIRRNEWLALAQGAAAFRDSLLIPLMLAENGVRKTDGAKRLNRYLTVEQIEAIEAIPPIGSDPERLVVSHTAIAKEYLTRARRLAAQLGEPWPASFERASLDLWRRELGIDVLPTTTR